MCPQGLQLRARDDICDMPSPNCLQQSDLCEASKFVFLQQQLPNRKDDDDDDDDDDDYNDDDDENIPATVLNYHIKCKLS